MSGAHNIPLSVPKFSHKMIYRILVHAIALAFRDNRVRISQGFHIPATRPTSAATAGRPLRPRMKRGSRPASAPPRRAPGQRLRSAACWRPWAKKAGCRTRLVEAEAPSGLTCPRRCSLERPAAAGAAVWLQGLRGLRGLQCGCGGCGAPRVAGAAGAAGTAGAAIMWLRGLLHAHTCTFLKGTSTA